MCISTIQILSLAFNLVLLDTTCNNTAEKSDLTDFSMIFSMLKILSHNIIGQSELRFWFSHHKCCKSIDEWWNVQFYDCNRFNVHLARNVHWFNHVIMLSFTLWRCQYTFFEWFGFCQKFLLSRDNLLIRITCGLKRKLKNVHLPFVYGLWCIATIIFLYHKVKMVKWVITFKWMLCIRMQWRCIFLCSHT